MHGWDCMNYDFKMRTGDFSPHQPGKSSKSSRSIPSLLHSSLYGLLKDTPVIERLINRPYVSQCVSATAFLCVLKLALLCQLDSHRFGQGEFDKFQRMLHLIIAQTTLNSTSSITFNGATKSGRCRDRLRVNAVHGLQLLLSRPRAVERECGIKFSLTAAKSCRDCT